MREEVVLGPLQANILRYLKDYRRCCNHVSKRVRDKELRVMRYLIEEFGVLLDELVDSVDVCDCDRVLHSKCDELHVLHPADPRWKATLLSVQQWLDDGNAVHRCGGTVRCGMREQEVIRWSSDIRTRKVASLKSYTATDLQRRERSDHYKGL
jgi:hypothetical protein